RVALREQRVGGSEPRVVAGVLDADRAPRLDDVAREPAGRGRLLADQAGDALPLGRADDEVVLLQDADHARLGAQELRRLLDDLVENGLGVELGREQAAGARELLSERARRPLRLEEAAALERAARRVA